MLRNTLRKCSSRAVCGQCGSRTSFSTLHRAQPSALASKRRNLALATFSKQQRSYAVAVEDTDKGVVSDSRMLGKTSLKKMLEVH